MPPTGLITDRGKRAYALWIADNATHGAVGRGNWPDKFNPPTENYQGSGLVDEIGRIAISAVRFITPDPAGTLNYDGDPATYRYCTPTEINAAASDAQGPLAPSADVEVEFTIPPNVMNGDIICELGIFANSVTPSSGYTPVGSVVNPGQPLYLVNIPGDPMYADKEFNRRVRIDASN